MLPLYLFSFSRAACFQVFLTPHHRTRWLLRRSAGGGASLWSRSRSSSLPVDIAGGGGSRGDLSSVQGSGMADYLPCPLLHHWALEVRESEPLVLVKYLRAHSASKLYTPDTVDSLKCHQIEQDPQTDQRASSRMCDEKPCPAPRLFVFAS